MSMGMATTEDPDGLIPCPFEPVHMVRRKRMQYHIMKCQKNMDMRKFRKCPFNAQHIMPVEEYEHHVRNCEGREVLEKEMIYAREKKDREITHGDCSVPSSNLTRSSFVVPDVTESWDDDNVKVTIGQKAPTHELPAPKRKEQEPSQPRLPRKYGTDETEIFNYSMRQTNTSKPPPIGRGRGRGRGLSQLIGQRPGNQQPPAPVLPPPLMGVDKQRRSVDGMRLPPVAPPSTEVVSTKTEVALKETEVAPKETEAEELQKKIRKLRKMLRQIEKLEQKQNDVLGLDDDQLFKISRKKDVEIQLDRCLKAEAEHEN